MILHDNGRCQCKHTFRDCFNIQTNLASLSPSFKLLSAGSGPEFHTQQCAGLLHQPARSQITAPLSHITSESVSELDLISFKLARTEMINYKSCKGRTSIIHQGAATTPAACVRRPSYLNDRRPAKNVKTFLFFN